jgi:hypothetical protein
VTRTATVIATGTTPTNTATPAMEDTPTAASATPTEGETSSTPTETSVPATATASPTFAEATSTPVESDPTSTPTETPVFTPRNPPDTPMFVSPTPTSTRLPFSTRTGTITPTASATALPTDTEGPTPEPSETPTATPSPTIDRGAQNDAALYVASGMGGGERVAIHFLRPPRRSREQTLVAFGADGAHSIRSAPIVPVTGDINGDGAQDLIVGQSAAGERVISDHIAVFKVSNGTAPVLLDEVAAFPDASSGSGNLAVADVDSTVAGDEILVGADGSQRRASTIKVFGGLADGPLRLLHSMKVVASRLSEHRPLQFATGDLAPDVSGREIVVAQPNGYVSVHGLGHAPGTLMRRFNPFDDQVETDMPSIAIGDVLPGISGEELVVAIPGRRDTGLVRIFNAMTATALGEMSVFTSGTVRTAVSLWVADVIDTLPGAEIIVGQGPDGGELAVYSFATGSARRLFTLPGVMQRTSTAPGFLAIGDLIPNMAGLEVAIAQSDATVPIGVYHLTAQEAKHLLSVSAATMDTIGAIAAAPRR